MSTNVREVGINEWDNATTYPIDAIVYVASGTELSIYESLQAANLNKDPETETDWWVFRSITYEEYDVGTTYAKDVYVIDAENHLVYQSQQAANTGNALTDTDWWLEATYTEPWKVFDAKIGSQAESTKNINYQIEPGVVEAISFFNLEAGSVSVAMTYLESTSSELITDTTDLTDISWNNSYITVSGNELTIGVQTNAYVYTTITTTGESAYRLSITAKKGTSTDARYAIRDVTNSIWIDRGSYFDKINSSDFTEVNIEFFAPAGCTEVRVYPHRGDDINDFSGTLYINEVSAKELEVVYDETIDLISTENVIDGYTYCFSPILTSSETFLIDLPPYATARIHIDIDVYEEYESVSCGEIVLGRLREFGATQDGAGFEVKDFSRKTTDSFGNYSITERAFSKRISMDVLVNNALLTYLKKTLEDYRAKPVVCVPTEATDLAGPFLTYGYYRTAKTVVPYPNHSILTIEWEGLT
jgi:hypothetical protein